MVLDSDEDLAAQVRAVASTLRPRPGVDRADDVAAAEEVVDATGPFDLIIAGPAATKGAGLVELRRLCRRAPGTRLVLTVDRWRSADLREAVRTGALDILRLPVTDEDLRQALELALAEAQESVAAPAEWTRPEGLGRVIAVVSASGGAGKTFLATNVGYYLQSLRRRRTCLLDLDLQFGEVATALRLRPQLTVADLVGADEADRSQRFEDHLVHHESGLAVLAGPEEPAEADSIDGGSLVTAIDTARARFEAVVIDTSPALTEAGMVAIDKADCVLAVATLDIPSLRNLGVLLVTLKRLKIPTERVHLVLNKIEPEPGIDLDKVARHFPQGFAMVLPYGREVSVSLNMGHPVLAYAPRSEVARALSAGLDGLELAAPGDSASGEEARRRRRFTDRFKKPA